VNRTTSAVLPEATIEVIASLAEHRALSTGQVHAIHLPGRGLRRTQQLLADLEQAELVGHAEARSAPRRLWFLSEHGADVLLGVGELKERPKLLGPKEAAGPLRAHTFGVNEVGISFLEAARERGDEFGPLSWRHEIAHPMSRGRGRSRRTLFTDAVLTYLRLEETQIAIEQRLIELDRATLSVDRLVSELARYAQLYRAADKKGERLWRSRYVVFPRIICVLTGAPRKALVRRREVALLLLGSDPYLSNAPQVEISFCLLDDLKRKGPFKPIFRSVGEPERKVNWLGEGEAADDADPAPVESEAAEP
jgi:protein involved in plasmid replication-relaxation